MSVSFPRLFSESPGVFRFWYTWFMTPSSTPDAPPEQSRRGWWISGALILALLTLTALFVDVQEMLQVIRGTNLALVLAGIAFLLLGIAIIDMRWWHLLSRRESLRRIAHVTHASYIAPILTPIPNYISRVVITSAAADISLPQATTGMVVERMIAQIMRISAIVLAIALGAQSELSPASMARSVAMAVAVLIAYLLAIQFAAQVTAAMHRLLTWMRLREARIEKITAMVRDALCTNVGMKELLLTLAITIVMWTFFFLFHYLVILAMPLGIDAHARATIAMGALALTPPSAPAMLGIYQISQIGPGLILQFGRFEDLLPYSLLLYFLQLIVWMALTLVGLSALKIPFIAIFRFQNITLVSDDPSDSLSSPCS